MIFGRFAYLNENKGIAYDAFKVVLLNILGIRTSEREIPPHTITIIKLFT